MEQGFVFGGIEGKCPDNRSDTRYVISPKTMATNQWKSAFLKKCLVLVNKWVDKIKILASEHKFWHTSTIKVYRRLKMYSDSNKN